MRLQAHIQNGVVVFDVPVALPDGTAVRVEPITSAPIEFWAGASLDQLAERQGVAVAIADEDMVGGWPADELQDGFEDAVVRWRLQESQRS